ncbi:MAG: carboxylating nicotinate-nucleotide diphosphorylase [Gemmatimonadales bacterium]|jgi:nicotinate-nucleotide pyrophosphorylase (carboxylating)
MSQRSSDPEMALIEAALAEDIGEADWTTRWTISEEARGSARIVVRADGVIAGTRPAEAVFRRLDPEVRIDWRRADGDGVQPGSVVADLSGRLHAILTAERTALNFLGRLSGIATLTSRYVEAVEGTGCRVVDTRKTTPGWRRLEKEAVVAGGGENHRSGLYDMVLLKENHLRQAGGVGPALDHVIERARAAGLEVEVEVTDLAELGAALERPPGARPDRILLDNMTPGMLRDAVQAVRKVDPPVPLLEASGGITLDSVRAIADTGVDLVSVGALTHSAATLDLSLLLTP